ncbi:hypothetical protein QL285_068765 [Trifolium repens]|nr:hypothetical protein QL285_068765 [Trifolium repens]
MDRFSSDLLLLISWRTSSSHRGTMEAIVLRWNADFLHFLGFFLSFCILDYVLMLFLAFVGFPSWVGGKHACVDLTGVSSLVGLTTGDFTVGRAALNAASSKVAKHERACSDNQHAFIPFAFDTFGFLAPDVVTILKRVQRVMHSNVFNGCDDILTTGSVPAVVPPIDVHSPVNSHNLFPLSRSPPRSRVTNHLSPNLEQICDVNQMHQLNDLLFSLQILSTNILMLLGKTDRKTEQRCAVLRVILKV